MFRFVCAITVNSVVVVVYIWVMCLLALFKVIVLGWLFWLFSGGVADSLCLWFDLVGFGVCGVFLRWLVCDCFGKVRFGVVCEMYSLLVCMCCL